MAFAEPAPVGRARERKPAGSLAQPPPRITNPVIDRVEAHVILDPYLSLVGLARYSGLSVRKLRTHLADVAHPLPCYRVGGKILVRRSEFDAWIAAYRQRGRVDVDRLVNEVVRELSAPAPGAGGRALLDKVRNR
jgi:helix-turn-helix protein